MNIKFIFFLVVFVLNNFSNAQGEHRNIITTNMNKNNWKLVGDTRDAQKIYNKNTIIFTSRIQTDSNGKNFRWIIYRKIFGFYWNKVCVFANYSNNIHSLNLDIKGYAKKKILEDKKKIIDSFSRQVNKKLLSDIEFFSHINLGNHKIKKNASLAKGRVFKIITYQGQLDVVFILKKHYIKKGKNEIIDKMKFKSLLTNRFAYEQYTLASGAINDN